MIDHLIINSLVIFGVYASTRDGMIFGFVAKFVTRQLIRLFLWAYGDGKLDMSKTKENEFMNLGFVRIDATEKAGNHTAMILKPLFDCPPCMASVWGIPFALIHPINVWTLVYLFALSGLNYIIMKLISR